MRAIEKTVSFLTKLYREALRLFEKYYWFFFAAACLTLAFFCFRCLDVQYVDSWDEARHGVNAYEMIQNGDYIRHTYNYQTDDWNLKPSVSYWGIILGFKLFGYSVFGLRFVSALAYLVTGILCGLAASRYSREASILVMGFFCANERPLSAHLARAGDADALFLLFFTIAMLAMLQIRRNRRYLYVCGLSFSLAFLTKSWHAGVIAVIGGIFLLGTGQLFRLKAKEWAGFLASVFSPLLLWFGWRYTKDGWFFLKQMVEVDLLARTGSANFEGHEFPFSFYYDMVFGNGDFIYPWLLAVCAAGLAVFFLQLPRRKVLWKSAEGETCFGLLLWFLIPFLGFSLIRTKLIWYCYPCTVPLFMGAAIVLGEVLRAFAAVREENHETAAGKRELLRHAAQAVLSWAAAAACIVLTVFYMKNAYFHVIREAHGDPFQLFMQNHVSREASYAGKKAYVQVPGEDPQETGSWDQNMLFMAEISGDFHCEDGGAEGFLDEKEPAVLFISQAEYAQRQEELQAFPVVKERDGYLFIEKNE